jgi:hypothetical protein
VVKTDTQTGMLPGIPGSAICVQRFDDSLNSAIRITYRISLRSSSLREPRYPLLKAVRRLVRDHFSAGTSRRRPGPRGAPATRACGKLHQPRLLCIEGLRGGGASCRRDAGPGEERAPRPQGGYGCHGATGGRGGLIVGIGCGNDPSAGSPTETLLRLHLPLNGKV